MDAFPIAVYIASLFFYMWFGDSSEMMTDHGKVPFFVVLLTLQCWVWKHARVHSFFFFAEHTCKECQLSSILNIQLHCFLVAALGKWGFVHVDYLVLTWSKEYCLMTGLTTSAFAGWFHFSLIIFSLKSLKFAIMMMHGTEVWAVQFWCLCLLIIKS